MNDTGTTQLKERLSREITGDVFFDAFNRGRYATDASFYQIMPEAVVVPRSILEALGALAIARDAGRTTRFRLNLCMNELLEPGRTSPELNEAVGA